MFSSHRLHVKITTPTKCTLCLCVQTVWNQLIFFSIATIDNCNPLILMIPCLWKKSTLKCSYCNTLAVKRLWGILLLTGWCWFCRPSQQSLMLEINQDVDIYSLNVLYSELELAVSSEFVPSIHASPGLIRPLSSWHFFWSPVDQFEFSHPH